MVMRMRLEAYIGHSGVIVDGPRGKAMLELEPTDEMHDVFIDEPGSGGADHMCAVVGNTYPVKDEIKELPYGNDGTQWNGDEWEVDEEMTATLCNVLCDEEVDLAIHAKAVVSDDDWGDLRHEIEVDDGIVEEETVRLMAGPESPMEGVSRSWAEDAAEVGGFESAEEFAEEFGLNVIEDDEAEEELGEDSDEYQETVFSSDDDTEKNF